MLELTARAQRVDELGDTLKASMFWLYHRYYEAASDELFQHDLHEKDYVILLSDRHGTLRGFSTLAILSFDFNGAAHRAIFSGDTIVDAVHWGEQALACSWIRLASQIHGDAPEVPLYWFLIVKGHRTYRYLPTFCKSFFPNWQRPTPPREQALTDQLASLRFGQYYDPARGVIEFPTSRGHLRPAWGVVPLKDRRRPEVRFFLDRNPGYLQGHELACLTELHPDNLRPFARRLFLEEIPA